MALASSAHKFTVNEVPFQEDSNTRINIKKRRERVVYRSSSNEDNINMSFLVGESIKPTNNLFISDRSTSLVQNRIPGAGEINTQITAKITLNVDQFLATDVFTVPTPTQPKTPLFYIHTLQQFNPTVDNFASKELLSIEFADYTLTPIAVNEYVLDTATGEFYNNLENDYDVATQTTEVTFLQYTVRTTLDGVISIDVYRELVDNSPVYTLAGFDDIDAFGVLINDGRKKYLAEETFGGTQFEITFPAVAEYAYKELPESRLRILQSSAVDATDSWHVQLTNGRFITSLRKTATTFQSYKYEIAEFDSQTFVPFPPYKLLTDERATWITKNLVKVSKNIVNSSGIALYLDIIVLSSTLTTKYAYTTDPGRVGLLYSDSTVRYTSGILSLDSANGFIEVSDNLASDDLIYVTYYTEEKQYAFTNVDFNPINNVDILDQRIAVYIAPETIGSADLDRTVHYVVMDPLGRITFSSQAATSATSTDPATAKMVAEDFHPDGRPRRRFFYDVESTAEGLSARISGVNSEYINELSFVDKYTVDSQLMNLITTASGTTLQNAVDNTRFLVLGEMYVGESMGPQDYEPFDVREQGGGIKTANRADAIKEQAETNWYWDLNARRPYPSTGAFYVEVPQSLHEDWGGKLTREEVKGVVERHMKAGGYGVIKFYGTEPTLTTATPDSGSIDFYWPSYGTGTTYKVYSSKVLDGPWDEETTSDLTDVASGNWYTVSGLISSTKYYVYVEATKDGEESDGPIVAVTTTAGDA